MRKILKRIALALTGLGLVSGSAVADAPNRLHDEVRNRILNEVSVDHVTPHALRAALGSDPDFGLLVEYYGQRSLEAIPRSLHARDAVQETMLKIWKQRPQIFLRPHDEVVRYFKTSARHNLLTEIKKAAARKETGNDPSSDPAEAPQTQHSDPAEEAAGRDLYHELASRLTPTDLDVLDAYLSGAHSRRRIAAEAGISRYAAGRSMEKIKQLLETLMD